MIQIEDLSNEDNLRLSIELVKERFHPSRCPQCESATVQEELCIDGSLCDYSCGGDGGRVFCEDCGITINEAECEEAEES